jgi:23S rRNA pseudouridine1911/1915/1917 synthase
MLHAENLEFDHPASGESMRFNAPLPDEFAEMLRLLRAGDQQ